MLIRHKSLFFQGIFLLASFFVIFFFLFSPVVNSKSGIKINGLQYADEVFNGLSKGSSYFIPEVKVAIKSIMGHDANLSVNINNQQTAEMLKLILEKSGINSIKEESGKIIFNGDLGKLLLSATEDSNLLFYNEGAKISEKYQGQPPLVIASLWWHLLNPCIKELQKQKQYGDAKIVDLVIRKALEPGNNFYGIEATKVSEHILLICGLIAFYLIYTIWYGFGIYRIFEGIGLLSVTEKK